MRWSGLVSTSTGRASRRRTSIRCPSTTGSGTGHSGRGATPGARGGADAGHRARSAGHGEAAPGAGYRGPRRGSRRPAGGNGRDAWGPAVRGTWVCGEVAAETAAGGGAGVVPPTGVVLPLGGPTHLGPMGDEPQHETEKGAEQPDRPPADRRDTPGTPPEVATVRLREGVAQVGQGEGDDQDDHQLRSAEIQHPCRLRRHRAILRRPAGTTEIQGFRLGRYRRTMATDVPVPTPASEPPGGTPPVSPPSDAAPPGALRRHPMTRTLVAVGIVIMLAGVLFGYDQGVISGALDGIKKDFNVSTFLLEVITSWVTLGAMGGALVAGALADRLGRRLTILLASLLFTAGALIEAFAPGSFVLVIGRLVVGFGVGVASVAAPLYAAEMAPARLRGRFVSLYQLAITIGIFVAYLVDYVLSHSSSWRAMLGVSAVPRSC